MNRRTTLAVALVVLAVPLFAWPVLSPPANPPDTFSFRTQEIEGEGIGYEIPEIAYENLSADGQRIVNRTIENGGEYEVTKTGDPPMATNYNGGSKLLTREDRSYIFDAFRRSRGPSLGELGPRLGALLLSVVFGATGGYLLVANE